MTATVTGSRTSMQCSVDCNSVVAQRQQRGVGWSEQHMHHNTGVASMLHCSGGMEASPITSDSIRRISGISKVWRSCCCPATDGVSVQEKVKTNRPRGQKAGGITSMTTWQVWQHWDVVVAALQQLLLGASNGLIQQSMAAMAKASGTCTWIREWQ